MTTVTELILWMRAPDLTPEFVARHERIEAAKKSGELTDELLNECTDCECIACGVIVIMCPHGEPLHFHHDGCPACYADERERELDDVS
jgi:hypothetical protein